MGSIFDHYLSPQIHNPSEPYRTDLNAAVFAVADTFMLMAVKQPFHMKIHRQTVNRGKPFPMAGRRLMRHKDIRMLTGQVFIDGRENRGAMTPRQSTSPRVVFPNPMQKSSNRGIVRLSVRHPDLPPEHAPEPGNPNPFHIADTAVQVMCRKRALPEIVINRVRIGIVIPRNPRITMAAGL